MHMSTYLSGLFLTHAHRNKQILIKSKLATFYL